MGTLTMNKLSRLMPLLVHVCTTTLPSQRITCLQGLPLTPLVGKAMDKFPGALSQLGGNGVLAALRACPPSTLTTKLFRYKRGLLARMLKAGGIWECDNLLNRDPIHMGKDMRVLSHLPRPSRGFTSLEIVLVAAVIGILVVIAVPSIVGHIPLRRVEASTRRLAGDLIYARARAISQNTSYIITFTSSATYTIHKDEDGDGVQDSGENVQTVVFEPGIQIGANSALTNVDNNPLNTSGLHFGADNKLTFDSRGECSESGSVYLIPTKDLSAPTRNDRARAVSVLQATGRVKSWRYNSSVANPGPWE